jgi:hypothetical protein
MISRSTMQIPKEMRIPGSGRREGHRDSSSKGEGQTAKFKKAAEHDWRKSEILDECRAGDAANGRQATLLGRSASGSVRFIYQKMRAIAACLPSGELRDQMECY